MKKAFALLTAALFALPSINAQDDQSVRFGIKLAPNMGWFRPDTKGLNSDGTKLGYTFGLMADFPVGTTGNYAFASGLYLTTLGGGYTSDYKFVDVQNVSAAPSTKAMKTDVNMRYIDLPLTIKMKTNEIGYARYFGQIGVMTSFNIRSKADFEEAVVTGNLTDTDRTPIVSGFTLREDEDFQNKTNLFRAALVVGGGMEYNFSGNTALLVGITYNNGFTNVLKGVEQDGKRAKVFNDYLELSLGIFF